MKKQICLLAAAFSIVLGAKAYGGQFVQDEAGLWYQNADGSWPVGWFQTDTGSWYCFDENGYARTGWYEENGIQYYLDPRTDGCLRTAYPGWEPDGTALTAAVRPAMPVKRTVAGSGTAFTGFTGSPAGPM